MSVCNFLEKIILNERKKFILNIICFYQFFKISFLVVF